MDEMPYYFPLYAGGYIKYSCNGEVENLVFIVKNYQLTEEMLQINFQGFSLQIVNENEDNTNEEILSLESQGKFSDIKAGMLVSLPLSYEIGTVCIPLMVEKESIDFFKRWRESRATLRRYPPADSFFCFSLS